MTERAQVLRAVNEWNIRGVNLAIVDGPADLLVGTSDLTVNNPALIGAMAGETTDIMFRSRFSSKDLCGLAEHEVGDLLKLKHTHGGIMNPDYGPWMRCRNG